MTLSMIYSFSFYPLIFPSLLSHRSWFLSHCLINLLNTEFCLGICFLESPYGKSKNNCEFFFHHWKPPLMWFSLRLQPVSLFSLCKMKCLPQSLASATSSFPAYHKSQSLSTFVLCPEYIEYSQMVSSNAPSPNIFEQQKEAFYSPAWDIGSGVHIVSLKSSG